MEGKLIRIRALEKKDLDSVMQWVNDPEITKNLSALFLYPTSKEQEEKWLDDIRNFEATDKVFAIESLDGVYLGNLGLHKINWKDRNAELGIVIAKKEDWDKGFGTDAVLTLLDFAFNRMNLHRIYLRVWDYNLRAIRSYEKCGLKKEGVLRAGHFDDGKYHDVILMGILKEEFNNKPG